MNKEQAIKFGKCSADMAFDQRDDPMYRGMQDVLDAYRDNVRDTLNDAGASEYEPDAWRAFDKRIKELTNQN